MSREHKSLKLRRKTSETISSAYYEGVWAQHENRRAAMSGRGGKERDEDNRKKKATKGLKETCWVQRGEEGDRER